MIYPISDSPWVSPIHCVPKKGGMTVIANEENELIPTRLVTGWRVCIDYRKLNEATRKDHFPLPFMDQMLERLAGNEFYCFLDGFSGYFQILIDPHDQEKTTFTCPYGTFAYRRMPFGLCNAPGTFQRCHKILSPEIECSTRAKVDVNAKLPHPTTVKGPTLPPSNDGGQVEVSNHGLKRILERTVGENRSSWSDKLDDALWAFRTAFKNTNRMHTLSARLWKVLSFTCPNWITKHIGFKHVNFDLKKRVFVGSFVGNLNELTKLRDQAYRIHLIYMEKTKILHDSKIKDSNLQCCVIKFTLQLHG
ncbi:reverse transcriptase domain-containing protein [Tanacetum coccineum]